MRIDPRAIRQDCSSTTRNPVRSCTRPYWSTAASASDTHDHIQTHAHDREPLHPPEAHHHEHVVTQTGAPGRVAQGHPGSSCHQSDLAKAPIEQTLWRSAIA